MNHRTQIAIWALVGIVLTVVFASLPESSAQAHSLQQLQTQLYQRERFFQIVDRPTPPFSLRDADGHAWDLAALKGKVIVLNFIYAGCQDLCPLHSELIAKLQRMINRTPMRDQVQFISITADPARDGPGALKAYGPAHGLDPVNWVFLTTRASEAEDTTRQLAESFGHKFTRADDGEYMHGVVTHVIDREGMVRGNFHGLEFDPTNLVIFVNALVNDIHKPGHDRGTTATDAAPDPAAPVSIEWRSIAPLVVLGLAVAWLISAIAFFAMRRRRAHAARSAGGMSR